LPTDQNRCDEVQREQQKSAYNPTYEKKQTKYNLKYSDNDTFYPAAEPIVIEQRLMKIPKPDTERQLVFFLQCKTPQTPRRLRQSPAVPPG